MNLKSVKRMCYLYTSLIILFCAFPMFGCNSGSANTISGKYIDEKNSQNFTEFKTDGTFHVHKVNMDAGGKYSVKDNRLVLTLKSGEVFEGKIEGNTIIGNGGGRSTKQ